MSVLSALFTGAAVVVAIILLIIGLAVYYVVYNIRKTKQGRAELMRRVNRGRRA